MIRRFPHTLRRGGRGGGGASGGLASGTQLLDFDGPGSVFARHLEGADGEASQRDSSSAFTDVLSSVLRTETLSSVARYLFERRIQNRQINSDDMNTGYTKSSATITVGQHDAPDGTVNGASELALNASNARIYAAVANADTVDNQALTHSLWIKHISGGNEIAFSLRDRSNTLTQRVSVHTIGTDWERISHVHADIGAGATSPQPWLQGAASGTPSVFAVYRNQVEDTRYPTSGRETGGSEEVRYADSLTFDADEVPEHLRTVGFTCNVRPLWANADLQNGDVRALLSMGPDDWIGFEKDAGSVYLRCYTGGVLRFGSAALTIARDTDYAVIVDLSGGVMTFGGVAGTAGTAATLPGGVAMRWGGMMNVDGEELDGGTTEPEVA